MITRNWSIRLATASALAALLYATTAIAVGFGDITLRSALNEPLDAEISLTNVGDIEKGQLLVQLAPANAFAQAGVSRDYYLTQLAFSVDINEAGETVVKVTSEGPILEPYLDFLVQLEWPAGRMVREYTLLLDLPLYSGEETSAASVSVAAASPKRPTNVAQQKLDGEAHRVVVGDTLWNVSKRLRPRGASILQTMDALYSQNPNAFVAGDANKMKEGAILRLPSFDEINEEAGDLVATQIGLTEPGAAPQVEDDLFADSALDESSSSNNFSDEGTFDADSEDSSAGRLELASAVNDTDDAAASSLANADAEPADSVSESGVNGNGDFDQLSSDLAVAQDEMNRTELENIELRERMVLLEAQVDLMSDLAAVSDNQALAEAADEAEVAAVAPAKIAKAKKPFDLVDMLENQPWIWAVVGLLVLLLVLFLRGSKNKDEETDLDQPLGDAPSTGEGYQDYDQGPSVNTGSNLLIDDLDGLELNPEDNLFDETDKEIFPEDDSAVSPEIFDSMVEAVAEADVYLSLGNIEQAVEILQEARAADATDTASRLKLMEIFFREGREDDLKEIYTEIEEAGDEVATAMASVILGPEEEVVENIIEEVPQQDEAPAVDEEPSADQEPSASEEPSADQEPSASKEQPSTDIADEAPLDLESLVEDQPAEPEASSESALGSTPEIDISDLLEEALESGDDIAIDELDESVLAGDFLDDNFMDGGIFADEASPEAKGSGGESGSENPDLDVDMPSSAELQQTVSEGVSTNLDDFEDYDSDEDINAVDVKLDLANTYIEMGDPEGAREILEEIIGEADEEGQAKARAVLESL